MTSLYRTPESKRAILALYRSKLESLATDYGERNVETRFGSTHVIVTGDAAKPPLVLIHGANGCAPIALDVYRNLCRRYRVFAVDVIAQPTKSAETRPSMKDASYGIWMNEVIAELGRDGVTLVGFSLGGFIDLETLIEDESEIEQAVLSAPVGVVRGNRFGALLGVFLPMKRFIRTGRRRDLDRVIDAPDGDRCRTRRTGARQAALAARQERVSQPEAGRASRRLQACPKREGQPEGRGLHPEGLKGPAREGHIPHDRRAARKGTCECRQKRASFNSFE